MEKLEQYRVLCKKIESNLATINQDNSRQAIIDIFNISTVVSNTVTDCLSSCRQQIDKISVRNTISTNEVKENAEFIDVALCLINLFHHATTKASGIISNNLEADNLIMESTDIICFNLTLSVEFNEKINSLFHNHYELLERAHNQSE
ncbi:hypothetical protein GF376_02545 [Candidatus Peregrinibacteria bacterium]|nr:hypothetical protein [Candidatus Peregrinibacteria bacterium]